mmetsp:Transcript_29638/g.40729  ORF Transcript_29638/g.40729 Transcript_29638/m.40729 type:complete len:138 (+) Transcript_29638:1-414(+)
MKQKLKPTTIDKLEQVKLMKSAYMENQNKETSNESQKEPPLESDNELAIIRNIEITEVELGRVSKYFSAGDLSISKSSSSPKISQKRMEDSRSDESERQRIGIAYQEQDDLDRDEDCSIDNMDGLLKWTSLLNIDDI